MVPRRELKYRRLRKSLQENLGQKDLFDSKRLLTTMPFPIKTKAIEIPEIDTAAADRFWSKVQRGAEDECWNWKAGTSGFGYGRFRIGAKLFSSHRVAYVIASGGISSGNGYHGTVIMHSCDNPACCNPSHLSAGTQLNNVRDMSVKGRYAKTHAR